MHKAIIFLFINFCSGCQTKPQDFILFQKDQIVPEVYVRSADYNAAAFDFCDLFQKATGIKPRIVTSMPSNNGVFVIIGEQEKNKPGSFSIFQKENTLSISGTNTANALYGVRYFFANYTCINQFSAGNKQDTIEIFKIPNGLSYNHVYAFAYREPYFPDNYNREFRLWNSTNSIDESWGLWGHNIHKFIKVQNNMLAVIGGKTNDEQYCFSSPQFEEALSVAIERHLEESKDAAKFMVMPNDNFLICQCDKCSAAGNTESNASPAVFALLNKLALRFPGQEFFSTAYNTTTSPPLFKLAVNAGVMISTMPFSKGVIIEESDKKGAVDKKFNDWKTVTGKIYLWDYAVNFDNFFEAYPIVSIAQKNLKYYKRQGVSGIFINGNEESYAAFGDLKCYLYAQLLSDPDIELKKHIRLFFDKKYPDVNDLLYDYYTSIEQRSYALSKPLEIYGGLQQARNKYLHEADFNIFYADLINKFEALNHQKSKDLAPLITSLTFQKLEILRTNGVGKNGYAFFADSKTATLNPEVPILLERLKKLSSQAKIEVYNESGYLIEEYIQSWKEEILAKNYSNRFFGKNFKVLSILDEDYSDSSFLNDGAVGFKDYYNNWLLSTQDMLKIEIVAEDVKGATKVSLGLLDNPRHNIFLPKEIIVTIGDSTYKSKIDIKHSAGRYKYIIDIPIVIKPTDKLITIAIVKHDDHQKMSTACDEIVFN